MVFQTGMLFFSLFQIPEVCIQKGLGKPMMHQMKKKDAIAAPFFSVFRSYLAITH